MLIWEYQKIHQDVDVMSGSVEMAPVSKLRNGVIAQAIIAATAVMSKTVVWILWQTHFYVYSIPLLCMCKSSFVVKNFSFNSWSDAKIIKRLRPASQITCMKYYILHTCTWTLCQHTKHTCTCVVAVVIITALLIFIYTTHLLCNPQAVEYCRTMHGMHTYMYFCLHFGRLISVRPTVEFTCFYPI